MANYQWLTSRPTIKRITDELVYEAQRVDGRALKSGVTYALVFAPYPTDATGAVIWTDALIDQQMTEWASHWDQNSLVPGVLAINVTQEGDASDQLRDVALVQIASTSGKSTTQATLLAPDFFPDTFPAAVAAIRAQLDAAEANAAPSGTDVLPSG
jgi:hypothetical protein